MRFLSCFPAILAVLVLGGCSYVALTENFVDGALLGPVDVEADARLSNEELLALEKQHASTQRYDVNKQHRKAFFDGGQYVFVKSRKPYVLGFAQAYAENRANLGQVLDSTLDLANLGLHVFNAGVTLAPMWVTLADYDIHAVQKSKEAKMMRMPSVTVFVPYPLHEGEAVDKAMVRATADLGDRLNSTGLCHYQVYPRLGTFGLFIPGIEHQRPLMCGQPGDGIVSVKQFGNAIIRSLPLDRKNPLSRLFGEGTVVATFYWVPEWTNFPWELQQKFHDYAWMGPEFTSALEGYKTLRPAIPKEAYTVLTGPDAEGNWKVFVAKEDTMAIYEPPWTREYQRALQQARQSRKDLGL